MTNSVAFVSGAAQGIGKAIALRLAKDGFDIAINDIPRNVEPLGQLALEIEQIGQKVAVVPADVSNRGEIETAIAKCVEELGSLDVMVANAGIARIKPIVEISTEEWESEMSINLTGTFHQYQLAARQMIKQGKGGKILGAASLAAYKAPPLMSGYAASKWALRGFTQVAAQEFAKHGITVNTYCPGLVDTPMWDTIDEGLRAWFGGEPGSFRKKYESNIVLGRWSQPEDVANFVSYLASPGCNYITGQSMLVDGGCSLT